MAHFDWTAASKGHLETVAQHEAMRDFGKERIETALDNLDDDDGDVEGRVGGFHLIVHALQFQRDGQPTWDVTRDDPTQEPGFAAACYMWFSHTEGEVLERFERVLDRYLKSEPIKDYYDQADLGIKLRMHRDARLAPALMMVHDASHRSWRPLDEDAAVHSSDRRHPAQVSPYQRPTYRRINPVGWDDDGHDWDSDDEVKPNRRYRDPIDHLDQSVVRPNRRPIVEAALIGGRQVFPSSSAAKTQFWGFGGWLAEPEPTYSAFASPAPSAAPAAFPAPVAYPRITSPPRSLSTHVSVLEAVESEINAQTMGPDFFSVLRPLEPVPSTMPGVASAIVMPSAAPASAVALPGMSSSIATGTKRPTVLNPLTGKQIEIGGERFKALVALHVYDAAGMKLYTETNREMKQKRREGTIDEWVKERRAKYASRAPPEVVEVIENAEAEADDVNAGIQ